MKNIAIMGGTFNPIHNGHIAMAEAVFDTGLYDEILFIPTGDPPHKNDDELVNKTHRWNMCELIAGQNQHFKLSDVEMKREGKTYTIDTILELKKLHPDNNFSLIIGADSLMDLTIWYEHERLMKICPFIIINRTGYEASMNKQIEFLTNKYKANITFVDTPLVPVSSSEIRALVSNRQIITELLPKSVESYIYENYLYGADELDLLLLPLINKLKKNLSNKRFMHSIAVKNTAIELALIHNCDVNKAAIAGLLHDCAKAVRNKKKLELCEKYKISISEAEKENLDLLHAKLGAIIAGKKYGIDDFEILEAIKCHTTGKPAMTLLEKIIFISDYIEPNRDKAPHLEELRELSKKSIDDTLIEILKDTLNYLNTSGKIVDSLTEQTYLYYQKTLK